MSAIAASADMPVVVPHLEVAKSSSDTLGVFKFAKGMVYYPLQWLSVMAGLFVFEGFSPAKNLVNKVAAVSALGLVADKTFGDGIKNGIPFDLGIKFYKTPSEHLYSLELLKYGFQRVAYSASASMWPLFVAVGMTLAMPYIAPIILAAGAGLTTAGASLGGLAATGATHSSVLAGASQLAASTLGALGGFVGTWPAAFAMKEGVTVAGMAMTTAKNVFLIGLIADVMADIVYLEKLNPNHTHKATRGEFPTSVRQ